MKRIYIMVWGLVLPLALPAYSKANTTVPMEWMSKSQLPATDSMRGDDSQPNSTWTTFGEDGSVQLSSETIQLLADPEYRGKTYPANYSLDQVPQLLENNKVALALWTLINVYSINPDSARTIAFVLANHGLHGGHYLNAFYTYAFADPEIFHFSKEESVFLEHPQRMEEKLQSCRALAAYTDKFLEIRSGTK